MQIGVSEGTEAFAHLTGDDVLVKFDVEVSLVSGLDHPVNGAVNRLEEELADGLRSHELLMSK